MLLVSFSCFLRQGVCFFLVVLTLLVCTLELGNRFVAGLLR